MWEAIIAVAGTILGFVVNTILDVYKVNKSRKFDLEDSQKNYYKEFYSEIKGTLVNFITKSEEFLLERAQINEYGGENIDYSLLNKHFSQMLHLTRELQIIAPLELSKACAAYSMALTALYHDYSEDNRKEVDALNTKVIIHIRSELERIRKKTV